MLYTISNDNYKAVISSIGAELKSFKDKNDIEYIWQANEKHWNKSSPILFPIVGHLYDDKTFFENKEYIIKIHGFLQHQDFELFHQKENEISLISTFNEETIKQYPFKYKIIITYRLMHSTLRVGFIIANEGKNDMPFNIGGHPGFNVPLFEGEKFEDYKVVFEKEESFTSPFVTQRGTLDFSKGCCFENVKEIKLSRHLFDIDTIVIPEIKSKKVWLVNKENKGIEVSFPNFPSLGIWSPHKTEAPFLCIEPWLGYGDRDDTDFNFLNKDYVKVLKEFEHFDISFDIKIL